MTVRNALSRPRLLKLCFGVGFTILLILIVRMNPQLVSYYDWTSTYEEEYKFVDAFNFSTPVEFLTGEDPIMTPYGTQETLNTACPIRNVTKCLKFLRETPPKRLQYDNETLIIHTAWRGEIKPVHQFLLYSFLTTQNLSRTILVYWIEQGTYNSSLNSAMLTPFLNHPNIVFKCYKVNDLATGTPLDPEVDHGEFNEHIKKLLGVLRGPLSGDLFRMLILYKYGGIYVDVDVILLRSFEPLMANEFAYSWSGYAGLNTAAFRLEARGQVISSMFDYIITQKKADFHPNKLTEAVRNMTLPIVIYPATFFDPIWPIIDRFSPLGDNPFGKFPGLFETAKFENNSTLNFWRGAYAYHFHNMYDRKNWTDDSWAGVLEHQWKEKMIKLKRQRLKPISFWRKENDELLIRECK